MSPDCLKAVIASKFLNVTFKTSKKGSWWGTNHGNYLIDLNAGCTGHKFYGNWDFLKKYNKKTPIHLWDRLYF